MVYVSGASGKIGSGKNYLTERLAQLLEAEGYIVDETTYATPLKDDVSKIIQFIRENPTSSYLANKAEITEAEANRLITIITPELDLHPDLTGWHKTKAVRQSLQVYGTEIRRRQDPDYWVKKIDDYVKKDVDIVFIPDVRFPNEADWIKNFYKGTLYRLDVPLEVRRARVLSRDSTYNEEAFHHESETALDNYTRFDYVLGETYDIEKCVSDILNVSGL